MCIREGVREPFDVRAYVDPGVRESVYFSEDECVCEEEKTRD